MVAPPPAAGGPRGANASGAEAHGEEREEHGRQQFELRVQRQAEPGPRAEQLREGLQREGGGGGDAADEREAGGACRGRVGDVSGTCVEGSGWQLTSAGRAPR